MKDRRKRNKRGRHLPIMPTAALLAADPELAQSNAELTARGFKVKRTVRPYRRADGNYTITVVWRRRDDDSSCVHTITNRYAFVEVRG